MKGLRKLFEIFAVIGIGVAVIIGILASENKYAEFRPGDGDDGWKEM